MRICLLCNAQSIHFQRWARHLQMRGHTVKVYSQEYESIEGVHVSAFGIPKAPLPIFTSIKKLLKALYRIGIGLRMRKELKRFKPHIMHAHFLTDSGWVSAWTGYHPLILTAHGSDVLVHPRKSLIDGMVARFVLHKADIVTSVARHMRRKLIELGCAPSKLIHLPNFVDIAQFNPDGRELKDYQKRLSKPVIMSVRSLEPIYNVRMLVETIPAVVEEIPDVKFLIIGDGSERLRLMTLANELKIESLVEFLPHMPHEQLVHYYQQADIYISASRSDGLCVSLLEAMASGLFPIVSDIAGSKELIEDGVNGYIFPIDDKGALRAKIIKTIEHPEVIPIAMKKNWDLIKSKYEEKHVLNEAERIYTNLMNKRDARKQIWARYTEN